MSGRILIIDDEDLFREDLASLLRQEGYSCQTAADGETGLRLAEAEEFDVVLCDLVMPGISGLEVVDRLSTYCPGTSVLVVTAYGSLETAVEAFRKGVADYLLKPVVSEDVLTKISRCLTHRRLAGARYCNDLACVMHFATNVESVDLRGSAFCPSCTAKLPPGLGASRP